MDEWMDGWTDGWMDGLKEEYLASCIDKTKTYG